jgi:hypothetical protein
LSTGLVLLLLLIRDFCRSKGIKSDESSDSGESDSGSGIVIEESDLNKLRNKTNVKIPIDDFVSQDR